MPSSAAFKMLIFVILIHMFNLYINSNTNVFTTMRFIHPFVCFVKFRSAYLVLCFAQRYYNQRSRDPEVRSATCFTRSECHAALNQTCV